jgi:predicted transcriptional regulator
MPSSTFTVRVDASVKRRLETLTKSTGRSRSYLAAEALSEYLAINEWQVAGIEQAATSLEKGQGVSHEKVREWIDSWGRKKERPAPRSHKK